MTEGKYLMTVRRREAQKYFDGGISLKINS